MENKSISIQKKMIFQFDSFKLFFVLIWQKQDCFWHTCSYSIRGCELGAFTIGFNMVLHYLHFHIQCVNPDVHIPTGGYMIIRIIDYF
jgi:hypothetical protein